jgi:H+-transporting ATPase
MQGLSTHEAQERLLKYGPNLIEEKKRNRLFLFLQKFWGPIAWMLELTIALQIFLHKYDEAAIIFLLLLSNALLSFFQEEHSNTALETLKKHLTIQVRALRDGQWQKIPAHDLVPGDLIHVRMGDIAPADIRIDDGKLLLDQSALTGESLPVEAQVGKLIYSGATVVKGEATGEVVATADHTYFGKTLGLLQASISKSHIKEVIFIIVKYLVIVDLFFATVIFTYALWINFPLLDLIPFILMLLVASLPVALPATFTLATAVGALNLSKNGVLVTHLTAIEEAATMDVLCADKTGTITQNLLILASIKTFAHHSEESVLKMAALSSDEASQDPIDLAIFAEARKRKLSLNRAKVIEFIPFDPQTKRTEVRIKQNKAEFTILKGSPAVLSKLTKDTTSLSNALSLFAEKGYRMIAVARIKGKQKSAELLGLIAFYDPPRKDAAAIIKKLKNLWLRILMLTGDAPLTAKTIATQVGIGQRVCSIDLPRQVMEGSILDCDVFANVFPEDKFHLVKGLQDHGHIVGMTGDGVNDAPALKQAEVGIAVANAMDVAKSAASIVLVTPGLQGILDAIAVSRRIYQRMFIYVMNKIIKSCEIIVFLSLGFMLEKNLILTPLLLVILLFTNDFASMAIAADITPFSPKPERWQISKLMKTGGAVSCFVLLFSFAVYLFAKHILQFSTQEIQTLVFLTIVFTGQGCIYLIRERRHFWRSRPSLWLLSMSVFDISIVIIMASVGILLTPIKLPIILSLLVITAFYLFLLDFVKIRIFSRLLKQ